MKKIKFILFSILVIFSISFSTNILAEDFDSDYGSDYGAGAGPGSSGSNSSQENNYDSDYGAGFFGGESGGSTSNSSNENNGGFWDWAGEVIDTVVEAVTGIFDNNTNNLSDTWSGNDDSVSEEPGQDFDAPAPSPSTTQGIDSGMIWGSEYYSQDRMDDGTLVPNNDPNNNFGLDWGAGAFSGNSNNSAPTQDEDNYSDPYYDPNDYIPNSGSDRVEIGGPTEDEEGGTIEPKGFNFNPFDTDSPLNPINVGKGVIDAITNGITTVVDGVKGAIDNITNSGSSPAPDPTPAPLAPESSNPSTPSAPQDSIPNFPVDPNPYNPGGPGQEAEKAKQEAEQKIQTAEDLRNAADQAKKDAESAQQRANDLAKKGEEYRDEAKAAQDAANKAAQDAKTAEDLANAAAKAAEAAKEIQSIREEELARAKDAYDKAHPREDQNPHNLDPPSIKEGIGKEITEKSAKEIEEAVKESILSGASIPKDICDQAKNDATTKDLMEAIWGLTSVEMLGK